MLKYSRNMLPCIKRKQTHKCNYKDNLHEVTYCRRPLVPLISECMVTSSLTPTKYESKIPIWLVANHVWLRMYIWVVGQVKSKAIAAS